MCSEWQTKGFPNIWWHLIVQVEDVWEGQEQNCEARAGLIKERQTMTI